MKRFNYSTAKKKATAAQPIPCPTVPSLQVMQVMCLAHGQGVAIHCQNAQLATSRPCSDTGHASFALVAFVLQVFHLSSVPTAPTASTHPTAGVKGVKPSISSPALGSPSPAQKSRWKGGWDWGKLLKIGKKCEKNQQGLGKSMPDPRHFTRGNIRTPKNCLAEFCNQLLLAASQQLLKMEIFPFTSAEREDTLPIGHKMDEKIW